MTSYELEYEALQAWANPRPRVLMRPRSRDKHVFANGVCLYCGTSVEEELIATNDGYRLSYCMGWIG